MPGWKNPGLDVDHARDRTVARSVAAELPARGLGEVLGIELLHPEHARQAEHLLRDDPDDRVRRRAGGRRVRALHLVALGLERPVVVVEEPRDATNLVAVRDWFGVPFDDEVDGGESRAARADDAATVSEQVADLARPLASHDVQCAVDPERDDRHEVRLAIRARRREPARPWTL